MTSGAEGRMFIEHIIFGIGIAILAGMMTRGPGERDHSWIVVAGAMAPDIDITVDLLHRAMPGVFVPGLVALPLPFHGSLHTIGFLVLFAAGAGLILSRAGIGFVTAALYAGIGSGSHLLEDALVGTFPGYPYLWPLSHERFMVPVFSGDWSWFGVANTETLTVALSLAAAAVLVRTAVRGPPWA